MKTALIPLERADELAEKGRQKVLIGGMNMSTKTEQELEVEANAATAFLAGGVAQLMTDGVEPASLVSALAAALGVMMAAAPRHMADALDKAVLAQIQQQRVETWAAVDAAQVL